MDSPDVPRTLSQFGSLPLRPHSLESFTAPKQSELSVSELLKLLMDNVYVCCAAEASECFASIGTISGNVTPLSAVR